jgi:septum formation protein
MASLISPQLVLASASPRRVDLLAQIGVVPAHILPTDIDESALKREVPDAHARRLAEAKAMAAVDLLAHQGNVSAPYIILAADTVVALGRRILPKAETPDQVRECLALLSGRNHRVLSAIHMITDDGRRASRLVTTKVGFKRLDDIECAAYIGSGEGLGKAGGYAIQGLAAGFVTTLAGSYSGVVGLPLFETRQLLTGLGYRNHNAT